MISNMFLAIILEICTYNVKILNTDLTIYLNQKFTAMKNDYLSSQQSLSCKKSLVSGVTLLNGVLIIYGSYISQCLWSMN